MTRWRTERMPTMDMYDNASRFYGPGKLDQQPIPLRYPAHFGPVDPKQSVVQCSAIVSTLVKRECEDIQSRFISDSSTDK